MQHRIVGGNSYAVLELELDPGETIVSESGAMAWMDEGLEVKSSARGGVLKGLKRKVLAGESFFQNRYTASRGAGSIALAPGIPGAIHHYVHHGDELLMQRGAYLASTEGVEVDSRFEGLRGFFNEGLFILKTHGEGDLFFSAYGEAREIQIDGRYIVDNGYAVAWDASLEYRLTRARKIRSFLFADQLLLEFSGRGRVWVQSRSPQAMASWVHPFRAVRSSRRDD